MSVCEGVIMHNFITKSPGCKYVHWRKLPVNLLEQPERLTAGTSENEEIVCPIRMHKNQLVEKIYGDLCCIEVARACLSSTAARPTSISGYSGFSTHRQLEFWELRFIMKKSPQRSQTDWLNQCIVHFEEVKVGQLSHWELVIDSEEAILWEGLLGSWRI